jgi:hypothetical protein
MGADMKKFGSQGQQRTAVLALKLSELEYIKSEAGEYPVLLLDDVMSELDEKSPSGFTGFCPRPHTDLHYDDRARTVLSCRRLYVLRNREGNGEIL